MAEYDRHPAWTPEKPVHNVALPDGSVVPVALPESELQAAGHAPSADYLAKVKAAQQYLQPELDNAGRYATPDFAAPPTDVDSGAQAAGHGVFSVTQAAEARRANKRVTLPGMEQPPPLTGDAAAAAMAQHFYGGAPVGGAAAPIVSGGAAPPAGHHPPKRITLPAAGGTGGAGSPGAQLTHDLLANSHPHWSPGGDVRSGWDVSQAAGPSPDAVDALGESAVDVRMAHAKSAEDLAKQQTQIGDAAMARVQGEAGQYASDVHDRERIDQMLTQKHKAFDDAMQHLPTPQSFFQHRGTFASIMAVISSGLAGALAGMNGGDPTAAARQIVQQDADEQQRQYDAALQHGIELHNSYSDALKAYGSPEQAKAALQARGLQLSKEYMDALALKSRAPQTIAKAREWDANFENQMAEHFANISAEEGGKQTTHFKHYPGREVGGVSIKAAQEAGLRQNKLEGWPPKPVKGAAGAAGNNAAEAARAASVADDLIKEIEAGQTGGTGWFWGKQSPKWGGKYGPRNYQQLLMLSELDNHLAAKRGEKAIIEPSTKAFRESSPEQLLIQLRAVSKRMHQWEHEGDVSPDVAAAVK